MMIQTTHIQQMLERANWLARNAERNPKDAFAVARLRRAQTLAAHAAAELADEIDKAEGRTDVVLGLYGG